MDDLKLFAKNDGDLQRLIDVVKTFSDAIGMSFGISKCAKLTIKRGKVVQTGPMSLGNCQEIPELDPTGFYRYLGFPEVGGIDHQCCKETILAEFERRLRLVWRSLLYGNYKVQATNSFCVPLLSYSFGVVDWTVAELNKMDILVRKVMREVCSLHPRSAIERLYLSHNQGGRGLLNVEHLYHRRVILLSHHLQTSTDALVKMCLTLDSAMPPRKSVVARANTFLASLSLQLELASVTSSELKNTVCDLQQKSHYDHLCGKPLHGKFYSWCISADVDTSRSFHWLGQSVHSETESTTLAVQDQVLSTRVYKAKIMKLAVPTIMCRLCFQHEETIQHLLAGCPVLAPSSYLSRHNMVARALHWHLCSTFGLHAAASWHSHEPLPVVENVQVKILWDFGIHTLSLVGSNRPDIVVFLKGDTAGILLLEVSCPADMNILVKEEEKMVKYQPLARQMRLVYGQSVDIIPIVFGVTGVASRNQKEYMRKIPAYTEKLFSMLQLAVILGTTYILRDINL